MFLQLRVGGFLSTLPSLATSNGEQFIRSLRWALPFRDSAIERTRHTIRCAASASQVKIAEALTRLGVPFNILHGPTWGSGYTDWKVARQFFHKPCACDLPYLHSSTSAFTRCLPVSWLHYAGRPPSQAVCKSCGKSSDVVCAACHYGFHPMSGCGLGLGANKEYFPEINESFPVCPDCMWTWVQFLCTCPSVIPLHHQDEVLTIMNASASFFEARHCLITNFVKDFTFCNAASKDTVIHAFQGHMGLAQPPLACAPAKI